MMREPIKSQYNPALESDKKNPALESQAPKPQDNQTQTQANKLENPKTAEYEVLLEQMAHDMGYEDKLKPEQQALLAKFGYSDGGMVNGPFGFEMRSFIPSNPEYPHPILAFRGTEFSKPKDLVADLEPESVGLQQFNANRRRIELELQKLSKLGKVWLTGHSLGGALAQLAGSEFADLTGRIITFQSPGIDAKHVAKLKKHNKANENQQVLSTHYQVAGDVVSGAGEALTPGELVKFEMNPSSGASMRHYGIGLIAGAIVGPGTGVVVKEAVDKVSKHRAFPVSNAVQENLAFKDLFENGKKFDKVAGISEDIFRAKATLNSDTFQNTRISEFLRHTIGKTSFELENATSNWGGDAKARDFASSNKTTIPNYTATQLLEHLNRLLDGWVSDDDVQAFETICHGVKDPKIMSEIRSSLSPRLEELHSEHQRKWIEDAINFKPIPDDQAVQRDALGTTSSTPNLQNLSGGSSLESTQRKELEEHFNVNLGDVRIHNDENAQKIATDLNAKAATIGKNILMGKDASTSDKELMGHEIAHVIQQREGKVETGVDKDQSLEAAAQLEGQNFAAGTKVRGKRAMLEPKKANSSQSIQRKEAAKTSDVTWTRDFSGQTEKNTVGLHLTRETDGNLKGTYQLNQNPVIEVSGKILESADNDLFLEGVDGSKWHGKYTATNTLLFGNIVLSKQTLKNLELKINSESLPTPEIPAKTATPTAPSNALQQPAATKPISVPQAPITQVPTPTPQTPTTQPATASSETKWTREFNGQLDGKYGIHMHLERDGTKLNGNYYYTKQGAGKAIPLTGVMDAESKAVKLEGNGETFNGAFVGEKGDKLEGKWTGGDKTLDFSVNSAESTGRIKPSGENVVVTEGDDTTLGLVNPISTKGLKGNDLKIANLLNSKGQYIKDLSTQLGVNSSAIVAILMVESGGQAFSESSKPIIRFENHHFYDFWGKSNPKIFDKHFKFNSGGKTWTGHYFRESEQDKWVTFHGDQNMENKVLQFAANLSEDAAYKSISIGLGQILGENFEKQGYKSPKDMYDDLSSGVRPQLDSLFTFISATKPKALEALKSNDYTTFAGYYNGWNNRTEYGNLISGWVDDYNSFAKKVKF